MMEKAYAKLNLILDIVGKREDGYHELKSLMIPIDFYDELYFEPSEDVQLISNVDIPNNAIITTVQLIKDKYHIQQGVKITLNKRIPIGAGLAGGSANISATIRGLNRLWALNLSNRAMTQLANALGSDTLFCLYNERAIIYGRGDQISILPKGKPIENITLACPNIPVLTKDVFKAFEKETTRDFETLTNTYLVTKNEELLYNDLLKPAFKVSKALNAIYDQIIHLGLKPHLSGSGSTLFFFDLSEAQKDLLKKIAHLTIIDTKEHQ
jgi:4-diphosphocytidyl-2-C-methyl-D-erythritol kinase